MKKIVILMMIIFSSSTFVTISSKSTLSYEDFNIIEYEMVYDFDDQDFRDAVIHFDYIFTAVVTKYINTKEYIGEGIPIPYSLYEVDIIEVYKGDITKRKVKITYIGGIIGDSLHVVNSTDKSLEEIVPIVGETYVFITNQVGRDIDINSRLHPNSMLVEAPVSMTHVGEDNSEFVNGILSYLFVNEPEILEDIVFEEPGGGGSGGNDGTSFDKAIELAVGYTIEGYTNGNPVYYTFDTRITQIVIQSFYTSSQIDVDGYLYNSLEELLIYDYDSGQYDNFEIIRYMDVGNYYIKVEPKYSNDSGTFDIGFEEDSNCSCYNDVQDLVLTWDLVNSFNKIVWDGTTQYNTSWANAVEGWNNEDLVEIVPDNILRIETLEILDYTETGTTTVAYTSSAGEIGFNTTHFSTMTPDERVKTMMHELGHALGMAHMNANANNNISVSESNTNIMHQGIRPQIATGPCDRNVYIYLHD